MSSVSIEALGSVVKHQLDSVSDELREISLQIHARPELAYEEVFAHELLTDYLERKGFRVVRQACGLKTAFVAEYTSAAAQNAPASSKVATVGFLSEFDALPKIGHACGHNLIAICGVAAALGFKAAVDKFGIAAHLKVFGSPAEETTGGKIHMIKAGAFENVDLALMAHPGNADFVYAQYLALQGLHVSYHGKSSHAAAAPWDGVNALDAVVMAYNSISMLRQQSLPTNRVHGIITNGGAAPNTIPDFASSIYYIRSQRLAQLNELKAKILGCLEGAAAATGARLSLEEEAAFADVRQNEVLARLYDRHIRSLGATIAMDRNKQEEMPKGSTDMGNVTHVVPGIHPIFDIGCNSDIHTEDFREAAKSQLAHERTLRCAAALSLVGLECATDAQLLAEATADFASK
ncbi:uncharacterized protein BJ171DRAFT_497265 [Polychytrium aggregatum]|uniref:uncharacterized protein n=1 Tax=Polychytrium aggregatum TaxID=110093 RepID=UPI0022FE7AED|nr:uncharacterized protein BJ171DRAFT_497265 [Polychytrium aggregatum]KAI9206325.1 hypothetical protein BJ171DRAFT_497265 [Polychytrium aggregatum]